MQEVMSIISTLGFPIAMCLLMAWYVKKKDETHSEEIKKLSETINQQTLNIQKLVDRFDSLLSSISNRKSGGTKNEKET